MISDSLHQNVLITRILSFVILAFYFINIIITMFVSKETPISYYPYPQYIGFNYYDTGKLNSKFDEKVGTFQENLIGHKDIAIKKNEDLIYQPNGNAQKIEHKSNYPFLNTSTIIVLEGIKIVNSQEFYNYKSGLVVYFGIGIISLVVYMIYTLKKLLNFNSNGVTMSVYSHLFTLLLINVLNFFRIGLNKGYPESMYNLNVKSISELVKGLAGPIFAPQGYIGLFGIEPRNISIYFSILSIITILHSGLNKTSIVGLYLAYVTSLTQGILYTLLISILFSKIRSFKFILILEILLIPIYNFDDNIMFQMFVLLINLFCMIKISKFGIHFDINHSIKINRNFLYIIFGYLIISIITVNSFYLKQFDQFLIGVMDYLTLDFIINDYMLWGRAFLLEFPGRVGTLILFFLINIFIIKFFSKLKLLSFKHFINRLDDVS
jgi:hypothetical protein